MTTPSTTPIPFDVPADVLNGPLPHGWDTPVQRRLLQARMAVAERAAAAFRIEDDDWVIDEREPMRWSLNRDQPELLEGRRPVQRMGSYTLGEAEYVEDELMLTVIFQPGSPVLDALDHDVPGRGNMPEGFVDEERRRAIEAERQTLLQAMGPASVPATPSTGPSAARRRL